MANQEHLYFLLNSDAARWNHWKLVNSQIQLDFSNAELREIQLTEKDLSGANFSNADLRGANLSAANLSYANLDRWLDKESELLVQITLMLSNCLAEKV